MTVTGSFPKLFNCIGKQAQTQYPVDGLSMVVLFRRDVCKQYMKVHSTVRFSVQYDKSSGNSERNECKKVGEMCGGGGIRGQSASGGREDGGEGKG